MVSANWAGFVDQGTGAQFTQIVGQWVVPRVEAQPLGASGSWIGIDGTTAPEIIQTGTGQNATASGVLYFGWVELYPAPPQLLGPVNPGDTMYASIIENSPGIWTVTEDDITQNYGWTGQVAYSGPGTSSEWIEEAPGTADGSIQSLADFGTVQFWNLKVAGPGTASALLDPSFMADPAGNILAYPTSFDAASDSFTVTYGSPPEPQPTTTTTQPTSTPTAPTTTTTEAPTTSTTRPPTVVCAPAGMQSLVGEPVSIAVMRVQGGCPGYWIATAQGGVVPFGNAGVMGNSTASSPVVDVISTSDGGGYWVALADGEVEPFGDARSYGDMSGHHLNGRIIAMAATSDGHGYWLVGSDGGIFTFGDAVFYGSTGADRLNQPVVGIAPSPDDRGYWLVASDGGVFTFGDAAFLGSMGSTRLNRPVIGMSSDPGGRGYRMVASDGGIFSFGAPFFGSLGANPPSSPIVAMAPSVDGNGYYMLGSTGRVYAFGDAPYLGGVS